MILKPFCDVDLLPQPRVLRVLSMLIQLHEPSRVHLQWVSKWYPFRQAVQMHKVVRVLFNPRPKVRHSFMVATNHISMAGNCCSQKHQVEMAGRLTVEHIFKVLFQILPIPVQLSTPQPFRQYVKPIGNFVCAKRYKPIGISWLATYLITCRRTWRSVASRSGCNPASDPSSGAVRSWC